MITEAQEKLMETAQKSQDGTLPCDGHRGEYIYILGLEREKATVKGFSYHKNYYAPTLVIVKAL